MIKILYTLRDQGGNHWVNKKQHVIIFCNHLSGDLKMLFAEEVEIREKLSFHQLKLYCRWISQGRQDYISKYIEHFLYCLLDAMCVSNQECIAQKHDEGVWALLEKADRTAEEKVGEEVVFKAMADTLSDAWRTLIAHLERRRSLLQLASEFFDRALEVRAEVAEFSSVYIPPIIANVRLQQNCQAPL